MYYIIAHKIKEIVLPMGLITVAEKRNKRGLKWSQNTALHSLYRRDAYIENTTGPSDNWSFPLLLQNIPLGHLMYRLLSSPPEDGWELEEGTASLWTRDWWRWTGRILVNMSATCAVEETFWGTIDLL